MDIKTFQELSKRTMPKEGSKVRNLVMTKPMILTNYCLGLVGEAAELTDYLKKVIFHGHDLDIDKIKNEMGDFMHYVAGLANLLELDLEDVLDTNIKKLSKRYPEGFSVQASITRMDTYEVTKEE